ncbi:hypothetical protein FHS18_002180 [Paenibacillus phyllosphaerae]|uniref:Uncharacterized protein n=1 Tax=Paenibacillus phyllosphaerae TaxID=274593 RepID=A0A7W5FMG9_9BACL|nr:hypothetical protein [Paenibacillus phyllosphaerae]MBB3110113.1 hypothetical protein [Paenibacillus phyllosphaerae]
MKKIVWLGAIIIFELLAASDSQVQATSAPSISRSDVPHIFIDESKYSGDSLEIVKLINMRTRYINKENLSAYMNLLHPQSPLYHSYDTKPKELPYYKISKVELISSIKIAEQRRLFEAMVLVEEHSIIDTEVSDSIRCGRRRIPRINGLLSTLTKAATRATTTTT